MDAGIHDGPAAGERPSLHPGTDASVTPPASRLPAQRLVLLGASAGGLEALEAVFDSMPANTGAAFVVVQHLSPDFRSLMPELLARHTSMPVVSIDQDLQLDANTVYVLSAARQVLVDEGRLRVQPRDHAQDQFKPINACFESAAGWGARAAVVVLSGSGNDGAVGARRVRQAGGLVLAQNPGTARFDSMPRAVIDAGLPHDVVGPAEVSRVLEPWLRGTPPPRSTPDDIGDGDDDSRSVLEGPYAGLFRVLQRVYDLDFNRYKQATLGRRIDRWLHGQGGSRTVAELVRHLEDHPTDVARLFSDLLIGVTSFFRDPAALDVLRRRTIEPLVQALPADETLRIWCCACSTGEEAYTLAMLALEAFERAGRTPRLRVMATDLHAPSVQHASLGVYGEEALRAVPDELRDRYFEPVAIDRLKVREILRRTLVFSTHNVLKDPPFQRIDLVSCRNLLIYLLPEAQVQVLSMFHVALRTQGTLFLGGSESPSALAQGFSVLDEGAHLYLRKPGSGRSLAPLPPFSVPAQRVSAMRGADSRAFSRLHEVVAQHFLPPGFLVDGQGELVHVYGDAGRHLRAAPGRFTTNVHNLLVGPLRTAVTMALRDATARAEPVAVPGIEAESPSGGTERLRVEVDPVSDRTLSLVYYMVRVLPETQPAAMRARELVADVDAQQQLDELHAELLRTREALHQSLEDVEAGNEELQSSNEELLSANEELQSSNEELHALNEELYTVNAEHEQKILELRQTSTDLSNLILATELAIIFLDNEGRLRLFTPPVQALFPLRQADIGRELRDFLPRKADARLYDDVANVIRDGRVHDVELQLEDGRVLRRRAAPYRDAEGAITGVALVYLDLTDQVRLREQALQLQTQERLRKVIELLPHLMWTADAGGSYDFVNAQWVHYTGVGQAAQLGQRWLDQVHADDREALRAAWREAVSSGRALHTRYRMRRHDGAYRWFDAQALPETDADGRVIKWYGSCTDVHDLGELQFELQRRERFSQLVADHIHGLVGYWDHEQRNRFANRHYLDWFGRTQDELRGRPLRDLLGEELYEQARPHVDAVLLGQRQQFELSVRRPDGTVGLLRVEYWPHVENGQVLGFVASGIDITSVQESRRLADRLFQVSPMAQLIVDEQGRIVRWNPAAERLTGYSGAQLLHMPVEGLVSPYLRDSHRQARVRYLSAPTDRRMGSGMRFPLQRADGTLAACDIELATVTLDGRAAVVASLSELPPEAQTLGDLDKALQARAAFLAQMSHEIRTPLNAIVGMAQLLQMESPTPKQSDRLQRIDEASTHLLGIVDDILDYSKMEAGRFMLHVEPFDLDALLDRSLALVADRARLKQLSLSTQVQPLVPRQLLGDAQRIEQIVVNYLTNAIKFTPQGRISVRVSSINASDQRVVLRVEVVDTGIGITPEEQGALFQPFRQVGQGHGRRFGGTGLGLAISRRLAQAMNGDCGCSSQPGVGSTFWFTAQLERAGPRASSPRLPSVPTDPEVRALCQGRQVLLVEDNPVNRIVSCDLLQAVLGIDPETAEDGLEALDKARERVFDLILMDVQLPGIDGLEATRRIHDLHGCADVPVVALTANVMAEDVNACMAAGMRGHLGKPVTADELKMLVRDLWGARATPDRRPEPARQTSRPADS